MSITAIGRSTKADITGIARIGAPPPVTPFNMPPEQERDNDHCALQAGHGRQQLVHAAPIPPMQTYFVSR